jgi:hypothetical protein
VKPAGANAVKMATNETIVGGFVSVSAKALPNAATAEIQQKGSRQCVQRPLVGQHEAHNAA